jgi:hypothetical protein
MVASCDYSIGKIKISGSPGEQRFLKKLHDGEDNPTEGNDLHNNRMQRTGCAGR